MSARPSLARDERGAVMVMGVFMACFLCGCLWYLIGIGDAIAQRERMQNAADAVAFSAAAVQARGMNFICALNLVLVAIVAVYITLRYVLVLFRAAMKITGIPFAALGSPELAGEKWNQCWMRLPFPGEFCRVAGALWRGHEAVRTVTIPSYHRSVMKDGVKGIHIAEEVVAVGTPLLAEIAAVSIGDEKGAVGLSFSPGLLPDTRATRMLVEDADAPHDELAKGEKKAIGLPLSPEKIGVLCEREADWAFDRSRDWFGWGWDILGPDEAHARARWCGPHDLGGFFTREDGPMRVFSRAHNGSEWTQTYGVVLVRKPEDRARHLVEIATGDVLRGKPPSRQAIDAAGFTPYLAQAELYFDCDDAWHGASCNGGRFGAMYSMRWRARLVRVRSVGLLKRLASAGESRDTLAEVRDNLRDVLSGKEDLLTAATSVAFSALLDAFQEEIRDLERRTLGFDPGGATWYH